MTIGPRSPAFTPVDPRAMLVAELAEMLGQAPAAGVATQPVEAAPIATTPPVVRNGLLLPSTAANLLTLLSGEPPAALGSPTTHSLGKWLDRIMPGLAETGRLLTDEQTNYSQQDLDAIKAVTGYNLDVRNGATAVLADDGTCAPDEIGHKIRLLAATLEEGRAARVFDGEVPRDFLVEVFARYADAKPPFPPVWIDRAIAFREDRHETKRKVSGKISRTAIHRRMERHARECVFASRRTWIGFLGTLAAMGMVTAIMYALI